MSIFTRRHYVWLASAMRDHIHAQQDRELGWGETEDCVANARLAVHDLASALELESPAFIRGEFLHNVLCDPTDHTWNDKCPFDTE